MSTLFIFLSDLHRWQKQMQFVCSWQDTDRFQLCDKKKHTIQNNCSALSNILRECLSYSVHQINCYLYTFCCIKIRVAFQKSTLITAYQRYLLRVCSNYLYGICWQFGSQNTTQNCHLKTLAALELQPFQNNRNRDHSKWISKRYNCLTSSLLPLYFSCSCSLLPFFHYNHSLRIHQIKVTI